MTDLKFRDATPQDIGFVVGLALADYVGEPPKSVRAPSDPAYAEALAAIAADPNNRLIIVEKNGEPIGTVQLTFIASLGLRGTWRGLIEAVHVIPAERSRGYGSTMINWCVDQCRQRGCYLVQLTSNKARTEAHRFYGRLGFAPTHEGFKLFL